MTASDDDSLLISVVQQRGREMGRGESGFCQMGGRSGPGQLSRPPPLSSSYSPAHKPARTENSSMRLRSQRRRIQRSVVRWKGMSRADSRRCGCNIGRHPTQLLPEQEFSRSGPNILQPGFPTIDQNWRKQHAHSASLVAATVEEVEALMARQSWKLVVRSLGPLARGW